MTRTTSAPVLVENAADLNWLCTQIMGEAYYALDTEFHTERTYYPKLALIQLAWADKVALVDPLAVDLHLKAAEEPSVAEEQPAFGAGTDVTAAVADAERDAFDQRHRAVRGLRVRTAAITPAFGHAAPFS